MTAPPESDVQTVERLRDAHRRLRAQLAKVIVGQDAVLDQLLMAIFCRGHALLEAMQERKVSIGGVDYPMQAPLFVLATQNPIEQEGTYPLPEAQLDRFLFLIKVDYPTGDEEEEIMRLGSADVTPAVEKILH